jgi:hypothetical protein
MRTLYHLNSPRGSKVRGRRCCNHLQIDCFLSKIDGCFMGWDIIAVVGCHLAVNAPQWRFILTLHCKLATRVPQPMSAKPFEVNYENTEDSLECSIKYSLWQTTEVPHSIYTCLVTRRSKAWTVFARSNTGIVGSNPTWGMDVRVRLFCVCAVLSAGSGLATGWSPAQEVLPTV